jgi:3'-phosphoadenosine 5'-phosphosulfate sulfotransferase (PAPS reductase)/FAD synthetase
VRRLIHVPSVSSGKDSQAILELCVSTCPRESIQPIFCDTGNEDQAVYDHLDYLEKACAVKITRLKADFSREIAAKRMFIARDRRTSRDESGRKRRWSNKAKRRALSVLHPTGNPFLDLCLWKGRFPSRKAQFCTEELKRNMAVEFQLDLIDKGFSVLSWQGVRRDESRNRSDAKKMERVGPGLWIFRPIVEWTAIEVFEYFSKRGLEPNPLYKQGMKRVGCMPCINVNKDELKQIAMRFPDHIARIVEWEKLVSAASKRQIATFIPSPGIKTQEDAENQGIRSVVEWSKTTRGGRQYDLLGGLSDTSTCASSYGLCG